MTSAMIVRSLHRRTEIEYARTMGCRTQLNRNLSGRGTRPPPSTSSVESSPIALLPGP